MKLSKVALSCPYLWFLFLIGCTIAIVNSGVPAQARSLAEILETKEIRVCVAAVGFEFGFIVEPADCRENCKVRGGRYELVMAFVETLGKDIKPKFLRVGWDEQFFNKEGMVVREDSYTPELLTSGQCDFYPGFLSPLPWRLKKLDVVILLPTRFIVIVHKSKQVEFKTPADLCGRVAATVKDSIYHTWLQEQNQGGCVANPIQMEFVTTVDDMWVELDKGRVDFILDNMLPAIWYTRYQAKNAVAAFTVGPMEYQGWGFRKEDKDLQAAVQKFFDIQRADENSPLNKIWEKYYDMTLTDFVGLITKIE
jgi:membrane-bound lytic murein transglycosylase MltF